MKVFCLKIVTLVLSDNHLFMIAQDKYMTVYTEQPLNYIVGGPSPKIRWEKESLTKQAQKMMQTTWINLDEVELHNIENMMEAWWKHKQVLLASSLVYDAITRAQELPTLPYQGCLLSLLAGLYISSSPLVSRVEFSVGRLLESGRLQP